ncbi:MAG: hypothetical protein ACRDS0_06430 [Pseudonocardiaceae bacterium]
MFDDTVLEDTVLEDTVLVDASSCGEWGPATVTAPAPKATPSNADPTTDNNPTDDDLR